MNCTHMSICGFSIFVLFVHANFGNSLTTKAKRCVEYRQQEGRWKQTILGIVMNTTERDSLMQCVRSQQCYALNIWHGNGTCELLPKINKCGEREKQNGWTFVHLGDCNGGAPWYIARRDWGAESTCLRWQYFDYISECPSAYMRAPAGDYCVALIPHKGLYLPVWYRQGDKFGSVSTDERLAYCRSGYLPAASSLNMQRGMEGVCCWRLGTGTSSRGWNMEGRHTSVHRGRLHKEYMDYWLLQSICTTVVYHDLR